MVLKTKGWDVEPQPASFLEAKGEWLPKKPPAPSANARSSESSLSLFFSLAGFALVLFS